MSDEINYDDMAEAPVAISDDELKSISDLAERQIKLEDWIENGEAKIKEAKANLMKLSGEQLPEAMRAAGVKEFKLSNGCEINLNAELKASITKANQEPAFNWLNDHGQGDLIKNEFKVVFGKGEDEQADNLSCHLTETGMDYNQRAFIHPQTLGAFVRSELAQNDHDEAWEKMFGVYRFTSTKIIRPKT